MVCSTPACSGCCSGRSTGRSTGCSTGWSGVGSDPGVCWSFTGRFSLTSTRARRSGPAAQRWWSLEAGNGPSGCWRLPVAWDSVGRDSEVAGRRSTPGACAGTVIASTPRNAAPIEPTPIAATTRRRRSWVSATVSGSGQPSAVTRRLPARCPGGAGCSPVSARPARRVLTQPSRSTSARQSGAHVHVRPQAIALGRRQLAVDEGTDLGPDVSDHRAAPEGSCSGFGPE